MLNKPITITCQNSACEYFMTESGKKFRRNGHNSAGNQQYHCLHCNTYFVETRNTPLFRARLDHSQVEVLVKSSVEKLSIRAVSRLTNIDRGTVPRYYRIIGARRSPQ
jgi:transposase-like protein